MIGINPEASPSAWLAEIARDHPNMQSMVVGYVVNGQFHYGWHGGDRKDAPLDLAVRVFTLVQDDYVRCQEDEGPVGKGA